MDGNSYPAVRNINGKSYPAVRNMNGKTYPALRNMDAKSYPAVRNMDGKSYPAVRKMDGNEKREGYFLLTSVVEGTYALNGRPADANWNRLKAGTGYFVVNGETVDVKGLD
jgi:hypothetical protein